MRFAVFFEQDGGCDHTIQCGHKLVFLPDTITTMEEARAEIMAEDGEDEWHPGYYGNRMQRITIYQIGASEKVK